MDEGRPWKFQLSSTVGNYGHASQDLYDTDFVEWVNRGLGSFRRYLKGVLQKAYWRAVKDEEGDLNQLGPR